MLYTTKANQRKQEGSLGPLPPAEATVWDLMGEIPFLLEGKPTAANAAAKQGERGEGKDYSFLQHKADKHLQLCGTRADFLKQFSAQKHRDAPARDTGETQRVCRADNRGKRC